MECIFYYLCCFGCCGLCGQKTFVKKPTDVETKRRTYKQLSSVTRSEASLRPAKGSSPRSMKLADIESYRIGDKFKDNADVFRYKGYEQKEQLGKGVFGNVWKVRETKCNVLLAVKVSDIQVDPKQPRKKRDRELKAIQKELFFFKFIRHLHIVKMSDYFLIIRDHMISVAIVMQLGVKGDLNRFTRERGPFAEITCKVWMAQMLTAMVYMHKKNVAHRDLKLSNIMLDENEDILISDFGLCQVVRSEDNDKVFEAKTYCGTAPFMAPELFEKKINRQMIGLTYNAFKVDVWALAVILFNLLTKKFPFNMELKQYTLKKMRDPNKEVLKVSYMREPPSKQLETMIKDMFEANPNNRPTMEKVSKYEWIREEYKEEEKKCRQFMDSQPK